MPTLGSGSASVNYSSEKNALTPTPPKFDVVVIHPSSPDDTNWRMELNPGTMRIENRSVRYLIRFAYDLHSDTQLLNAPAWLESEHFDITGKEDETLETCPLEERRRLMRLLVRGILEERFRLQVNQSTAEIPVLALVVAKGGSKIKPAQPADHKTFRGIVGPPGKLDGNGATMQLLADRLASTPEAGGRAILDKTQMPGEFSWSLRWTPDTGSTSSPSDDVNAPPPLFTALQEQLGLKLESQKSTMPAVSVTHIEQPSEN
jgi:uncharacterized protein (TIGR03435 family)